MKKLLITFGVFVVLLVLVVLIGPSLIPVETYKSQILAQVKQAQLIQSPPILMRMFM